MFTIIYHIDKRAHLYYHTLSSIYIHDRVYNVKKEKQCILTIIYIDRAHYIIIHYRHDRVYNVKKDKQCIFLNKSFLKMLYIYSLSYSSLAAGDFAAMWYRHYINYSIIDKHIQIKKAAGISWLTCIVTFCGSAISSPVVCVK